MNNRPTGEQLTESIEMLKQSATIPQYHHVWRLIYEIEALKKDIAYLEHTVDLIRSFEADGLRSTVRGIRMICAEVLNDD